MKFLNVQNAVASMSISMVLFMYALIVHTSYNRQNQM